MQRHFHDSNLEENKGVLDVIRRRVDAFDDRFVFGEFSEEFERSGCYLPSDKGLHAGYNFALLLATNAGGIRDHLETLARFPDHWPCIAFSNHDVMRTATRFGTGAAKAMLALLAGLRGTLLLYQGEELGLPEVDLAPRSAQGPGGRSLLSRCSKAATAAARPCPGMRNNPISAFPRARPGCPWDRSTGAWRFRNRKRTRPRHWSSRAQLLQRAQSPSGRCVREVWNCWLPGPGLAFSRHTAETDLRLRL